MDLDTYNTLHYFNIQLVEYYCTVLSYYCYRMYCYIVLCRIFCSALPAAFLHWSGIISSNYSPLQRKQYLCCIYRAQGRLKMLPSKKKLKKKKLNHYLLDTNHVNPVVHTVNRSYLPLLAWRVTNPCASQGVTLLSASVSSYWTVNSSCCFSTDFLADSYHYSHSLCLRR